MNLGKLKYMSVPPSSPDEKTCTFWIEQASALLLHSSYSPSKHSLESFFSQCLVQREYSGERKFFIVAIDLNEDLVGFAQLRAFDREADLDFIMVNPSCRQQGIARGMLMFALEVLRNAGVTRILLEVGVKNSPALLLYRQLGFSHLSFRKGYYRSGEDAVLMELMI